MNNNYQIYEKYKDSVLGGLRCLLPTVPYSEIVNAVDYSINKRSKDTNIKIDNNYKNKEIDMTLLEITEYIFSKEPIITAFGILYSKKTDKVNPIIKRIMGFMKDRDLLKKEMFKYPKGSEEREKYNLLQLLKKIDVNGFYGLFGQPSCLFFNVYIAASITTQARSLISSAGMFFEMFLANNVKFSSLDEIITFIDNVCKEKNERKYDDNLILDKNITPQECFLQVLSTSGFNYIPDDEDCLIIWRIISNLDQQNINRLYYKNNLYEFMENRSMHNALMYLLKTLEKPFLVPDSKKIPKEISVELNEFCELLMEYVYYHHQVVDHFDKYNNMVREVCVITDTDSSIISLDPWFNYVKEKIKDVDLTIKHKLVSPFEKIECDEFGDFDLKPAFVKVDDNIDYSFYDEETIEMERTSNPLVVIPQDGVRYSIINIMAYCLDRMVNDYMFRYCENSFSQKKEDVCLIKMKNEFLFRRVLLTSGMKFYAAIQELQEGTTIPESQSLEIKGLPMSKGTLNVKSQNKLKKILYEDILKTETVDQVKVIKQLAKFEKEIYNSLRSGNKEFYKPVNIKSITSYSDPMKIQGIKGAIVYNELKDDDLTPINLYDGKKNIDLLKLNINKSMLPRIEKENPDKYDKILKLMEIKQFNKGISIIGVPKDGKIPSWLLEYVDYTSILSDNVKYLPIESIGLYRGHDNNNYTNILKII